MIRINKVLAVDKMKYVNVIERAKQYFVFDTQMWVFPINEYMRVLQTFSLLLFINRSKEL